MDQAAGWYRVASLRPRVRRHVRIQRHVYRGEPWYVVEDPVTQKAHRLSAEGYFVVAMMDGRRTIAEIWDAASARYGDTAPSQADVLKLFGELHATEVLQCDATPDVLELEQRSTRQRRRDRMQRLLNPMALRIPLFDPDPLLERLRSVGNLLFSPLGACAWVLLVGLALRVVLANWNELSEAVADRVLVPGNLVMLGIVFPLVKALHELGHGLAVKRWGGEVRETGLMFLVFMPVPYVDASASSAFRERYRRVVVGAAGMLVEVGIAAAAALVWAAAESGPLRGVAYNVMLVAGVSTLLFNANPLLRFDGYYILADLVESPNLANRSNRYLAYLVQRHAFGARDAEPGPIGPGEKPLLVGYGVASYLYRVSLAIGIAYFVAQQFFFIGLILAGWTLLTGLVIPVAKGLRFVARSPVLERHRQRAVRVTATAMLVLAALLFVVPLPLVTITEGVVWLPEQSRIRAATDCFAGELRVPRGSPVAAGQVIAACTNPEAVAQLRSASGRVAELERRYRLESMSDLVRAQMTRAELGSARRELRRAAERMTDLELRSPSAGTLVVPEGEDLAGRFVRQGDEVAYVLGGIRPTVRAVVAQEEIDLVRARTRSVSVRLAARVSEVLPSRILREVPAASRELPSPALTVQGGGTIANDPLEGRADVAFQQLFQLEAELPEGLEISHYGGRVYLRIDHGFEPLWQQWSRRLKVTFLRLLNA